MKCALYLRVSTAEQHYENQLPELKTLAKTRGLAVVATYAEKLSAVKARPAFEQMLADAHRGKFGVLLLWSLDRLHRSMLGSLQTVIELDRRGVQVISVREPWLDTGGPVRSLLLAIFGWVAEQERLRIGERTRAGLERARRRGSRLGRPKVDVDHDALRRLQAQGRSIREIAAALKVSVGRAHRAVQETTPS